MFPSERKLEISYEFPPEIKKLAIFPAALVAEIMLLQEEKDVMSIAVAGPGFASYYYRK